ncbi:MAG: HAD family phosphatase [Hungatella sp.]|jgi:putative hydrolase of the HAD superfamily|nr:HAD family phosphatase [Hungatella sp.]
MIRNLVFDMGNVLVFYDSFRVVRHFVKDEEQAQSVNTSVFVSPEWLMLDMGVMAEDEALRRMQGRLKTDNEKEAARLCLEHWHEYCMWPVPGMEELVTDLKRDGYGLYLCSNASLRMLKCYGDVIPGIRLFDGVLFSAEVKCMKPQKEMYRHLFDRFGLRPEECFFVDDQPLNIEGGRACGMDGYCFADGEAETLKKVIARLR